MNRLWPWCREHSGCVNSLPLRQFESLRWIIGLRQRAEREIAAELARQPKNASPSNVPPLPTLFENSPLLTQALASAESKQIAEELDRTRYNLADPSEGEEASIEDWEKALQNASSQLEHQRLRLVNLDLFNKYGANAWRISNFLTEQSTERIQREIEKVTAETEDVNRTRKVEQVRISVME